MNEFKSIQNCCNYWSTGIHEFDPIWENSARSPFSQPRWFSPLQPDLRLNFYATNLGFIHSLYERVITTLSRVIDSLVNYIKELGLGKRLEMPRVEPKVINSPSIDQIESGVNETEGSMPELAHQCPATQSPTPSVEKKVESKSLIEEILQEFFSAIEKKTKKGIKNKLKKIAKNTFKGITNNIFKTATKFLSKIKSLLSPSTFSWVRDVLFDTISKKVANK